MFFVYEMFITYSLHEIFLFSHSQPANDLKSVSLIFLKKQYNETNGLPIAQILILKFNKYLDCNEYTHKHIHNCHDDILK